MKRASIALLLLACFILPLGGTYIFLMVRREVVRSEAKQRLIATLDRAELVKFRFSAEETKGLKIDSSRKEFEKDGLMFDIVYSVGKNDSTQFWCWPDHQESDLNKRLENLAAKAFGMDQKSKQVQNDLIHFFALLYHEGRVPLLQHLPVTEVAHQHHRVAIIATEQSADTPPPRA